MRLGTVYDQQIRNHRERGDTCFPVMIFRKEVIWKVKKWKQNDKRIILMIYADKYWNKDSLKIGLPQLVMKDLFK